MKTSNINQVLGSQRGFTLIELLVALAISVVIMSGVVQMLTVSKSNFVTGRELAMSQENARYAMKFITDEIRMGGFTGCISRPLSVVNTINGAKDIWYLRSPGVSGFDHQQNIADFPAEFRDDVLANTDALIIRRTVSTGLRVTLEIPGHNGNAATIPLNKSIGDIRGQPMTIASPDCQRVGIFQVAGPNSPNPDTMVHNTGGGITPGNCRKELGNEGDFYCGDATSNLDPMNYDPGSRISELRSEAYYIGLSGGVPALFRERMLLNNTTKTPYTTAEELVKGVENMQVSYGIDTQPDPRDGIADKYVDAGHTDLDDFSNVIVSMRLSLRMRSQLPVYAQPTPFGEFEGIPGTNGSDRFMRQDISTTITVRNF